jgi:hypothetical protein
MRAEGEVGTARAWTFDSRLGVGLDCVTPRDASGGSGAREMARSGREALATPQSAVWGPGEGARTPTRPQDGSSSGTVSGSLSGRLRRFASKVLQKAASPLLPTKVFDSSAKIPLRSRRIAAHPLSKVPVAKRGEILIMQRLGFALAQSAEGGQQDFEAMFEGSNRESHVEAMWEIFPEGAHALRSSGRRVWGYKPLYPYG